MTKMRRAAVLLFMSSYPAVAADLTTKDGTIKIYQRDGTFRNETYQGNERPSPLRATQTLLLHSGERIAVVVMDPNPFLFQYGWKEIPPTVNENYAAVLKFAQSISTLLTSLGGGSSLRRPAPLAPGAATDREFFQGVADNLLRLSSVTEAIPGLIRATAGSSEAVARVKTTAEEWQFGALKASIAAQLEVVTKTISDPENLKPDAAPIDTRLLAIKLQESTILEALAQVDSFLTTLASVDVQLPLGNLAYDAKNDAGGVLTISVVPAQAVTAAATKRPAGTFAFVTQPYTPVLFGVGAAVVYSFVKSQEFVASPSGDHFVITRKADNKQFQGVDLAAVLTLTPRGWSDPTFGGQFEIGVNPKNLVGLYIGGGIRFYDLFTIGGGLALQQVNTLAPGLHENMAIPTAADLKIDTPFKAGGYVHISISATLLK